MFKKSKLKLFRDEKNCSNCVHSKQLPYRQELLCSKNGIVSSDYKCRQYSINITAISTHRNHLYNFGRLKPEDFSIK